MTRARALALLGVALVAAGVCVRLGYWQLSRLEAKRTLNAAAREALSAAPRRLDSTSMPAESVVGRMVFADGRFERRRHVLLAFRERRGSPGVEVLTALELRSGDRVLVNRGWLPSPDGEIAQPQGYDEPGEVRVVGLVEAVRSGQRFGIRLAEDDSVKLFSARGLDADTLLSRFGERLPRYVIRQLPGPGVPLVPERAAPLPLDESVHAGYATQWFSFAAVILVGAVGFIWTQRRRTGRPSGLC